jgi:hypothetical protein
MPNTDCPVYEWPRGGQKNPFLVMATHKTYALRVAIRFNRPSSRPMDFSILISFWVKISRPDCRGGPHLSSGRAGSLILSSATLLIHSFIQGSSASAIRSLLGVP